MQQLKLLGLLLKPSFISSILSVGGALSILMFANVYYIVQNSFVSKIVASSPENLSAFFGIWRNELLPSWLVYLDRQEVYFGFIMVIAATIGLIVFASLELLTSGVKDVQKTYEELKFTTGAARKEAQENIILRWVVRISAAFGWAAYWALWLGVIALLSIYLTRIGLSDLPSLVSFIYIIAGTALLIASLHVHVIFARFLLLRPRIFSST